MFYGTPFVSDTCMLLLTRTLTVKRFVLYHLFGQHIAHDFSSHLYKGLLIFNMPSSGTWLITDRHVRNLVKWQLTFLFPKLFAYKKLKITFFVSQDTRFVYIERKVVHFKIPEEEDQEEDEECCQWIYACSCN